MNQKLIILVGASGSGKTTFAKQYIKENPGTVRVNRDDMRRQILGELTQDYYSKKNSDTRTKLEKHITVIQNEMIRYWLLQGFDVIADNTHLRKRDITEYIHNFGSLSDIYVKPIQVDPVIAKNRIILREGVGTNIQYIDRQLEEYNSLEVVKSEPDSSIGIVFPKIETPIIKYDPELQDCWIVDIDGTCASCEGIRSPYNGEKLYLDKPIEATRKLLSTIPSDEYICADIIYVSGREDKWKEATKKWIIDNNFPSPYFLGGKESIYMRKTGDTRKDYVVKEEIIKEHILGKYNILGVFDDRYQVTDHLRDNMGLFVFQVNQHRKIF